jgi:hypothetical protein
MHTGSTIMARAEYVLSFPPPLPPGIGYQTVFFILFQQQQYRRCQFHLL